MRSLDKCNEQRVGRGLQVWCGSGLMWFRSDVSHVHICVSDVMCSVRRHISTPYCLASSFLVYILTLWLWFLLVNILFNKTQFHKCVCNNEWRQTGSLPLIGQQPRNNNKWNNGWRTRGDGLCCYQICVCLFVVRVCACVCVYLLSSWIIWSTDESSAALDKASNQRDEQSQAQQEPCNTDQNQWDQWNQQRCQNVCCWSQWAAAGLLLCSKAPEQTTDSVIICVCVVFISL